MAEIKLTKGFVTLVEDIDAASLAQFRWYASRGGSGRIYAARRTYSNGVRGIVYMHRQIMGCPPDKEIDHLNGNSLDNRRRNLRIATRSENLLNSSLDTGKGFWRCKQTGRWIARVSFAGRRIMLGRFPSPETASAAAGMARVLLRQGVDPKDVPSRVAAHL